MAKSNRIGNFHDLPAGITPGEMQAKAAALYDEFLLDMESHEASIFVTELALTMAIGALLGTHTTTDRDYEIAVKRIISNSELYTEITRKSMDMRENQGSAIIMPTKH